jgi:NADH dehydrogenase (ubiquinone) 1 alpha subcomplex subunit 9
MLSRGTCHALKTIARNKSSVPVQRAKRSVPVMRAQPFDIKFGTGGRSSNSGITATVFGAYGFVGRYLVNELGQCGSRVYVPFRGCELEVRHLKPMCDLGQLGLMPFSPRDRDSIRESLENSDIVINMIGKHYETKHLVPTRRADGSLSRVNYDFEEVNVTIPETIAEIAKEAGVKAFIHVSALSADKNSLSKWSRTKAEGEEAVRRKFPDAIIVKPATVFGHEDRFLNWIAELNQRSKIFPLIDGGVNLVQPVHAEDVGRALMAIIEDHEKYKGCTFQLFGPAEYTYKEIVEFVADVTTVHKEFRLVPAQYAAMAGSVVETLIAPVLTKDGVAQMTEDNVMRDDPTWLTLTDLGIEANSMDKAAFDFLHRFRPGGHFTLVSGYH